ncbi:hypothetical protein F4827_006765 [Paraburkholderia bannensis]|uniref:Uncharacterized protein n=1 Tax=Paraburkholderia bannensis TaxID=765414 RepID=A0A7W9WWR7_9BURK|nr:hypothetical protein [Paraburkholderia bannensis]MBB6106886.1 hypothetical protein [Paraburkholderia bannensis]
MRAGTAQHGFVGDQRERDGLAQCNGALAKPLLGRVLPLLRDEHGYRAREGECRHKRCDRGHGWPADLRG